MYHTTDNFQLGPNVGMIVAVKKNLKIKTKKIKKT